MKQKRENGYMDPLVIIDGEYKSDDFDLQSLSPPQINTNETLRSEDALKQFWIKGREWCPYHYDE